MKSFYWLLLCIMFFNFLTFSCTGETDPIDPDIPVTPVNPSDEGDIDIDFTFDYRNGKDNRTLLQCDSYTQEEKDSLYRSLPEQIAKVRGKRNKVVTAATFLVSMKHRIPYGHEWIVADDPTYEFVGRYTRKGLFLDSFVDDKGTTHLPWGCMIKTHPRYPREKVKNLGDYYENGLHCSSFIAWSLFNADAVTDLKLLEKTYANNYRTFPMTTEVSLKTALGLIRPGDLLWFPGHIAMVIGVKGDIVVYASAEGGSAYPGKGVSWITFNKKTTDFDTFAYKSLIQMNRVYGD